MKNLVKVLRDLSKTIILGIIISITISIVIGLIAILVNKGEIRVALGVIRSALLIIGAFGLLLSSLLIIKKRSENQLEYINQWREKFSIFSYKIVLIFSSISILICGGIVDWFLYYKL